MRSAVVIAITFCVPLPSWALTIEMVPVGNPGNVGDTTGFGSVDYSYHISKYEITNAQYVEFLNAVDPTGANSLGLYISAMTNNVPGGINFNNAAANGAKYSVKPGRGQNPVVYVSWYDATRFANWLHNGQAAGSTESGPYTLVGGTPIPSSGTSIVRNPNAQWFLPSENEWYKAAYHQPAALGGDADDYWMYPTRTNSTPYSDQPPGSDAPDASSAGNFYKNDSIANGYDDGYAVTATHLFFQNVNHLTDVGAYAQADSFYGTYDQGGNVSEWNEQAFSGGVNRGLRGSSWQGATDDLSASNRISVAATLETGSVGFRVATIISAQPQGDYNRNGIVDAADYVLWRKTVGEMGASLPADGNNNGHVDPGDYDVWRTNFGRGSGGGSRSTASVPEPAGALLLMIGLGFTIRRGCRSANPGRTRSALCSDHCSSLQLPLCAGAQ